ncbi:hypothetical protein RV11_GL002819 [Enterococcus phoeniculicola]|uniref:Ascorbate-specific PTS system EIIA component n=1 Tax=Enterococcus phoeniculicola ATCC BAA-412 TaxID=1158610 RepID=R3TKR2_9ENTE|nr:PTS sugar transporter subunit IIA [Enterococcus phoeniculicola]EOL41658.1 hypothetical protein UC3_03223 [Enterococcus phoeniculicola ATCC BAA-412]EOT78848.1 hypothetical protein I589_00353 [Enterococcus phoeniculicola ATCC BAA-412]OJG72680.1 hypothetical protein RV11_GL002819 [Enterococcus phoeniculicola]
MLSTIVKPEYIQLKQEVHSFEEAIELAMSPLLKGGAVTQEYVKKVMEIYKETGPYIVITKHVALPHAPTEYGALATAMGITTLKVPVESGHETNDPVRYLFSLSAADGEKHLKALSELVAFLSDDKFLTMLDNATTKEEIINYIKKEEGNE